MGRVLVFSALFHLVALLVVPRIPPLTRHYDLAYEVYSVDLVQLPAEQLSGADEPAVEEQTVQPAPAPEQAEAPIPEEPVKRPKQIVTKPATTAPQKSLGERIAERLAKQDEKRPGQQATSQASGTRSGQAAPAGRALISASRFPYSWYLSVVQGKVTSNWAQPSARLITENSLSVLVSFRIKRDGMITALTVRRSSGRTTLDESATKAVRDSAPFPPLPSDYRESTLDVTIEFTITRE